MSQEAVLKASDAVVEEFDWGNLRWFTGNKIGNSETTTVGQCLLQPGVENFRHYHPNCEEILLVNQGKIIHSLGEERFEMEAGDTIVVPPNVVHNAKNVGTEDALLTIIFSTPDRQTVAV
ncbi:cupin domain-containing protein [Chloroflexi bacterium TSY]|nr:cupin domain-containing protein [Chloroflexi bacterium TSY]